MTSPLVERVLALRSSRPAIVDDRGTTTAAELLGLAARAAGALGPLEGGRVVLLAEQDAGWVASFLGILLAGGVVLPVSPAYPPSELEWFAADAGAAVAIVGEVHGAIAGRLAAGRRVFTPAELFAAQPAAPVPASASSDDAVLVYTSGTTGRPKGARLTHTGLTAQVDMLGAAWQITGADRLLHALPLHHVHGLSVALLSTLLQGASVRMLPRFDAERVAAELAGATRWMAVPAMYHRLRERDDPRLRVAAPALRLATSGSAALPASLAAWWRELAGAIPLERYGMTEIGIVAGNPLEPERRRPGSVGLPLPGVELRLDEHGELSVRAPTIFAGYHGRPCPELDEEGWFRTGDVAERDGEGYLRLLGRTSVDILKSGGYKISALEIEEALRAHPAVADAAVVGVPDEAWGERIVAAVVLRGPLEADELRAFARARLAAYKVPREVVFVDDGELPRNPMGKIVKPELRRRLQDRS